jgi:hypothetical protein
MHTSNHSLSRALAALSIPFLCAACGGNDPSAEEATNGNAVDVNTNPLSLEEAGESLTLIDELLAQDPEDAEALAALEEIRFRLDELNHLVARVELSPGRLVSFYETDPGIIGISETGPAGSESVLRTNEMHWSSPVDLYEQLAQAEAPPALVAAYQRQLRAEFAEGDSTHSAGAFGSSVIDDGVEPFAAEQPTSDRIRSTQQALTASDGPWYAENGCYHSGNVWQCMPNWGGGGYAQYNSKTSFVNVAPYSGDVVSVRFRIDGSTKFLDPVFPGQWRSWWWHSSRTYGPRGWDYKIQQHRWDILNASGDGFHWSFSFKWGCLNAYYCDLVPN